jgi:hypothetical protein
MPPVGFEPTVSAGERPKTFALDRAVTGTGIHYNVQYQIIKIVSTYGIVTTKNSLHAHLVFFRLLYSPAGVYVMTPAVASQRIWTPFCNVPLVNLRIS